MDHLTAQDVWTIVAASLVLFMTPGLAFFYGGMTRVNSALNMILMSFVSIGLVGVVWALWGSSMATAPAMIPGIVGNPTGNFGLGQSISDGDLMSAGFSATFAIITVSLISGSIADRTKFGSWCVFVPLWVTLVYAPLAFMVWADGGLFAEHGVIGQRLGEAIDFAGGLVVHINAGVAGLVLCLVLGVRRNFTTRAEHRPHNVPFVMLGAAILWFGWFGFNAGAATDAAQAGRIWVNTLVCPAAAMLGWLLTERLRDKHPTSLGAASGIVAGLVAITPACANVDPAWAIVLGFVSGVACALAVGLKYRWGYDDTLDVVGVHLVAGIIGTLALGFIATSSTGRPGLFYGGGLGLLVTQVVATVATVGFTALGTFCIAWVLKRTIGFRISESDEEAGIDAMVHAETAYSLMSGASGERSGESMASASPAGGEDPRV
ncbi:ammonium transporter [Kocuria sp. HSID16901]|uniref:ammonium transporter n=1 Tax=Kocuria sp. HSID16901 TaxID=2419505 RepID=UPI00080A939F|nr:ammonium transporter [Kocuria sp. HSID16901]RUQ22460.1 ammonium transporter [Kocuria sp. HSID16901]